MDRQFRFAAAPSPRPRQRGRDGIEEMKASQSTSLFTLTTGAGESFTKSRANRAGVGDFAREISWRIKKRRSFPEPRARESKNEDRFFGAGCLSQRASAKRRGALGM
jgi:hypothetical protein